MFAALPFADQLDQLRALVDRGDDPRPALAETAALADPSPFVRLLVLLHERGRLDAPLGEQVEEHVLSLSDAALQHLLSTSVLAPHVVRWVATALRRWDLDRLSALTLALRWLRRHAPAEVRALEREGDAVLASPPLTPPEDASRAARALVFASGARLAALARVPEWAPLVRATIDRVIDVLARAPKSISQAHAEQLLSRRVYADPGHFFFELLQNADDAGATRFAADVGADAITITHDGAPFSVLDLVGVLSIGQTTKQGEQIGLFGVGFKSVYEITDRPRVRSGALSFEIAHVSIPRALAADEIDETRFVLPRSEGARYEPSELLARATAIPPETLMTLGHVRALRITRDGAAERGWSRSTDARASIETVVLDAEGARAETLRYRVARRALAFEGPREDGRATTTAVLVAASVHGAERPRPVEGPTLYAFLPTAEHTGLRVLVHARFDVTLDRERRELDSAWNDAILREAGRALAELAASFGVDGLTVLSTRSELAASMLPLFDACCVALAEVPLLWGAAGERLVPGDALIAEDALAQALLGVDVFGRRVLAPLAPRERTVALELGALAFGPRELFTFAEATLRAGDAPPSWLGGAVLDALALAPVTDEALRALPILPSAAGLVSANAARLADPPWAALYRGLRPLVTSAAFDGLSRALLARLALASFEPATIAEDLRGALGPALLARSMELEAALTGASEAVLASIASIAFVPTREGTLGAPLHVRRLDPRLEPLAEKIAEAVPLATAEFGARPLASRLLSRFDLASLTEALEQGLAPSDALVVELDRAEDEGALPRALGDRLAALPLFADVRGVRRPLFGAERALLPGVATGLVPAWPWLAEVGAFARARRLSPIDAAALAEGLARATDLPAIPDAQIESVLAYLGAQVRSLSRMYLELLADAAVWRDAAGTLRTLGALRRGSASEALERVLGAMGTRSVAAPRTLSSIDALGLGERLPEDHALFVAEVEASEVPRADLLEALLECAAVLEREALRPLEAARIFRDDRGVLRALGAWDAPDVERVHRASTPRALLTGLDGFGAPWPLLDAAEERALGPLLDALAIAPPQPRQLLAHLAAFVDRPAALLAFAHAHLPLLDEAHRLTLSALPLLSSRSGRASSGHALLLGSDLPGLDVAALGLDDVVADDRSAGEIEALGLSRAERRDVLVQRVLPRLAEGAALQVCWPGADVASFASLGALAVAEGLTGWPIALSSRGTLSVPPLVSPSPEARALLSSLPIELRLSETSWASALSSSARAALLAPLSSERAVELVRAHAAAVELAPLYAWLRAEGDALSAPALSVLAQAPLFPSQRGERHAPRELVLDHDVPDLGLGWGLSSEVPTDIATWLRKTFEIDRHARRALTSHLLDGLAECAERDDVARAKLLLSFLARALGADGLDAAALEERARRLDVRARLEVPVVRDGVRSWMKPRFAWAPIDEVAREASLFVDDLPPRIALDDVDAPTQRLLFACGAREDVDEAMVLAALDRIEASSLAARRALARFLITRSTAEPARVDRLALRTRAWLPRGAAVFRPRDRVTSNERTRALLGPDSPRFIDAELARHFAEVDPDGSARARLGFVDAAALSLADVASVSAHAIASDTLLDWIEGQLVSGRAQPSDVRDAFAALKVVDDEGRPRPCREVAVSGARALLGSRRGDWSSSTDWPRTTRALGIPRAPDAAFIEAFLIEVGESLPASDEDALSRTVPEALSQLAKLGAARLPEHAVLAVREGARVSLVQLGDPRVLLASPPELAAALDGAESAFLEPLPLARDAALEAMLLASGVPDLYARLRVQRATGRAPRADLAEAAEALRARLPIPRAVREARVFGGVRVEGVLAVGRDVAVSLDVPGAIDGSALLLTPLALAQPELLAPLLSPDPLARARFLLGPSPAETAPPPTEARRPRFFERVRELFQSKEAPSTPRALEASPSRDEALFRPRDALDAQLDRGEGWVEGRRRVPTMGFVFSPAQLGTPWLYAPHLVAGTFHARGQRWSPASLTPPPLRGDAGLVVLRGRLPEGESMLPVPHYGAVIDIAARGSPARVSRSVGANGATLVRLDRPTELDVRVRLGVAPTWEDAIVADVAEALVSLVPDAELPEEALELVASLDEDEPPSVRAARICDFVRARYRYDPSYLEDPAVGHWLARVTRGRTSVHLAALHAGRDATHLGAGVCYELNTLACELLRRARIPAVLATGWVMTGGSVSEPDHLWALALLRDARGSVWMPIDASTTRTGRPLLVPRRPPLPLRPPVDPEARAPVAPAEDAPSMGRSRGAPPRLPHGVSPPAAPKRPKKRRPPRVELHRVLHHLGTIAEAPITDEARAEIERALDDPEVAKALLRRLLP